MIVSSIPKTHDDDDLGWAVLCDEKIYKLKNPDGTENKGNMPLVWGRDNLNK